jgi:putative ABC transport system permease protein
MPSLMLDVGYGWRLMWKNPGFTFAAVLTLALGIGANTAIFSIVNVLSIKPLPYREPSRVTFLLGTDTETGEIRFSLRVADYLDISRRARSFEQVAAYSYVSANVTGGDIPERVQAYRVTANTFELLGVGPARGRTFAPSDAQPGDHQVALLSDGLWRRRFGADPAIVGRRLSLNGVTHEIVGVMPPRFEFPVFNFKGDLWIPWVIDAPAAMTDRGGSATVIARVREQVDQIEASAELQAIMQTLATDHPATNASVGARVVEMGRLGSEQAGPAVVIVVAAVGIVLLLACGNVANLLLARGVTRSRELAVRAAVGASRWRIARQLLVESLLLALAVDALRSALPEMVMSTMPNIGELRVDPTTLAFTLGLTVAASLVFGLLPAWRAARPQLHDGLKEGATGGNRGTRRLRAALVVTEVALATVLLVTAGLLARSYAGLRDVNPGFSAEHLLTMSTTLPEDRYPTAEARLRFFEQAAEQIERLPGIRSAALVNVLPFSTYDRGTRFIIDGAPLPAAGREPRASLRIASPEYFSTMEIPVVAGRPFAPGDRADAPQAFVQRHFAGGKPIGRRLRLGNTVSDHPWITIVGVVGDVHHSQLTEAADPELYLPLAQGAPPMMMLAVRTDARPEALINAVRTRILEIDPLQPVFHVTSMSRLVADAMLAHTAPAVLMSVFSGIALLLAVIGVYGVVSYGVSQQMPELGLRLALGATPSGLLSLVLRRSASMVVVGVLLGAAAALGASGVLASLLYGVQPIDPLTYSAAAGTLLILGIGASAIPAWRASSAEPVSALRSQ